MKWALAGALVRAANSADLFITTPRMKHRETGPFEKRTIEVPIEIACWCSSDAQRRSWPAKAAPSLAIIMSPAERPGRPIKPLVAANPRRATQHYPRWPARMPGKFLATVQPSPTV